MRWWFAIVLAFPFFDPRIISAEDSPKPKKRLLVITESRGFVHDCVNRRGKPLCLVEQTLIDLGKKSGAFEAVCTQDSRKAITAENLKGFDAVFFYTTGSLPLSATQKADLISFVRSGKGFSGSHSATDTFYDWPDYGKLIGGYFDGHPWHEKIKVIVEDAKHPATSHLGKSFEIEDEIYQFKAPYDRKNLHVLMHLDLGSTQTVAHLNGKQITSKDDLILTSNKGKIEAKLNGKIVEVRDFNTRVGPRLGNRRDKDHALAWTQDFGKGRVFYTALGHRDEVWKDERFQKHMLGGLRFVLKLADPPKEEKTPSPRKAPKP
jgi:type 1 glutamine amidotransferase